MRTKIHKDDVSVWISANETYRWANAVGTSWPCSTLSGHRIFAAFDSNGLVDIAIDGKDTDCDANEFNALVSDALLCRLSPTHPCYDVVVEQFQQRKDISDFLTPCFVTLVLTDQILHVILTTFDRIIGYLI